MCQRYTHGHHDSVLRAHSRRSAENSAAYLLPLLGAADSLLDIGCGPGSITVDLAERVDQVTGVDNSAEVLEKARQTAGSTASRVDFQVGDVYALNFADDSFDVVHAHQVLQHVADPVAALREMRRVCRPGGIVAARDGDYGGMFWYPEVPELSEWLDLYREVARAAGGEPDAGRRMLSWAREAGFSEITPSASVWCYATVEERAWWAETWAERIVSSTVAEVALARGFADMTALRRIQKGWLRWSHDPDASFTIPHGELICRP